MTVDEAIAELNGCEYRNEGSPDLANRMKAARLVAVFGASDDLMEFLGAINDEIGAWSGATAYLTPDGLLVNDCDDDECPHFKRAKAQAATIDALWCAEEDGPSWTYRTDIPHKTFDVLEDGEVYCRGIVFSLDDV